MKTVRLTAAWICFFVIGLTLLLPKAFAATYFEYDGIEYYNVYATGVYVNKCSINSGTVRIPSHVNGYTVLGITSYAFMDCGASEVIISEGVRYINDSAFSGYSALRYVTIPSTVESIGAWAFRECENLREINFKSGLETIGESAFYGCDALVSVKIPDTVVSIGADAFYLCDDLQYVTIPESVTVIGENAFGNCYSLDSISVEENNTKFSSSNGVLFNKDKTKLIRTPTRIPTDYTIPNGVVSVEAYAFDRCRYLKSLTIPASVSNIGDGAFQGCDEITDVYYCGSAEQWAAVTLGTGNDSLTNATLHYITQASAPTASLADGEVESGTEITLTAEDGVTIYYSVDGSDPTNVYSAPIVITEDTTIKAFATKTGLMDSDVVTYTYTVKRTEESPDTPTAPDEPIVPADAPTLTFGDMQAKSGGTVVVPLAISNNPGIAGLSIRISYDPMLTLTELAIGDALSELDFTNPKTLTANPLKLLWDGVDNDCSNGDILYLTFTVAEGAEEGNYSISATYDVGDIYNGDMDDVEFAIAAGKVTVKNSTPGDVNDDGIVNGKDVTLIRRHVLTGYDQTINEDAADVNDDGIINGKDVTLVRRAIIGGYDVELK